MPAPPPEAGSRGRRKETGPSSRSEASAWRRVRTACSLAAGAAQPDVAAAFAVFQFHALRTAGFRLLPFIVLHPFSKRKPCAAAGSKIAGDGLRASDRASAGDRARLFFDDLFIGELVRRALLDLPNWFEAWIFAVLPDQVSRCRPYG